MNKNKGIYSEDIVIALSDQMGISKETARKYWQYILMYLQKALINNQEVQLYGIGVLSPTETKRRQFYNPQTKKYQRLEKRRRVRFRLSRSLARLLNKKTWEAK